VKAKIFSLNRDRAYSHRVPTTNLGAVLRYCGSFAAAVGKTGEMISAGHAAHMEGRGMLLYFVLIFSGIN
jgi:hypothetical protein